MERLAGMVRDPKISRHPPQQHYDFLASIWDDLYDSTVPYEKAFDFMDGLRRNYELPKSVLDVACGTGHLLEFFGHAGYETRGADLSPAMLQQARSRLPTAVLTVDDYHKLDPGRQFGVIVSFFNSFAYCLDPVDLMNVLKNLRQYLISAGLLIFDIFTTETPEEQFIVKSWTLDNKHVSRTFWGVPDGDHYCSKIVFAVVDRVTKEMQVAEKETLRGIFSQEMVLDAIAEAGLRVLSSNSGYLHETFVAQNQD